MHAVFGRFDDISFCFFNHLDRRKKSFNSTKQALSTPPFGQTALPVTGTDNRCAEKTRTKTQVDSSPAQGGATSMVPAETFKDEPVCGNALTCCALLDLLHDFSE
jgi:hypothetical protein